MIVIDILRKLRYNISNNMLMLGRLRDDENTSRIPKKKEG